jgi:predicted RND superfamily exporter protein
MMEPVPESGLMRRYFELVTRHPVPFLVVAAIVGLGLGALVPTLTRETSPDAFIPGDHPALHLKHQVEEEFGLKEVIAIGIIRDAPGGIFTSATLTRIRDLTRAVQELPGIDPGQVVSIATESGVSYEDGLPGYELLMPEVPQDQAGLAALAEDILSYELYNGTLVASDHSATCVLIRLDDELQAESVYHSLRELIEGFPAGDDEEIVVSGDAVVRSHMGKAVSDDALRMNFVCPVVMVLLIVLAYRTVRGTILPLCVIGGGSVMALGLMALLGVPVFIITNGIFVVIMALGIADSVHLLGQYYEEQLDLRGRDRRQLVVDTSMALWFPLLVTSLTDIAGFTALYVGSEMPPIRYFGLFTSLGVLGALLYSYTVVPAGLAVLPVRSSPTFVERRSRAASSGSDALGRLLGRLGRLTYESRTAIVIAGAVVIIIAAWGAARLRVNDARIMAFKEHHPIVKSTRALNRHFDGTTQLDIVVTAARPGGIVEPEALARIGELEAFTETLPHVGGTHSITGWVKRAHQKMNDDDPAFYAIPEDVLETMFYLDTLREPSSPMAEFLREAIDDTETRANLIVRMRSSEYVDEREVVERLQTYLAEDFNDEMLQAELDGRVYLDYEWLRLVKVSHIRSVVFSSVCVLLLTGLMFRSPIAGLLCTLPIGVAVLVNYAVMGLWNIPLGVGTSMFASIAIGAGVNFPIHLLDRLRLGLRPGRQEPVAVFESTLAFTGRALFFTAFVVACGFLLLMVSEFRTLVRFGLLIGLSTVVSFAASVTLLPAVVAVLRPRFVWGGGEPSIDSPTMEGAASGSDSGPAGDSSPLDQQPGKER